VRKVFFVVTKDNIYAELGIESHEDIIRRRCWFEEIGGGRISKI